MVLLIFFVMIAVATITPATANPVVTLPEAVRQGLSNNNLLKAEQYAVQAATADQGVAASRYLPRLLLEEAFSASNSPTRTFMMKLDQGRFTSSDFIVNNLRDRFPNRHCLGTDHL